HDKSSPFCSDDEGEESERVFFSPESVEQTRKNFENMLNLALRSQGVHPKVGKFLKRTFHEVDKFGGGIGGEKRRRTMPRTY
ncbi:hypothetical protein FB446DRAFT_62876, partial [Lentinula raphanica]